MAKVKPFRGIRPPKEFIEEVASRPYDVLNSEEARAEAEGNPKSLYHIIKPEIDFEPGTDEHDPKVYDKAVENFRSFREKGWLGLTISTARKMKGMSQEQLAAKANISRSHLSAIEAPNMVRAFSIDVLYSIADALGVSAGDLLNTKLLYNNRQM